MAVCGYTPAQIRGVYGVTASGMTGKGQTVAIVDAYASPTMLWDASTSPGSSATGRSAPASTSSTCRPVHRRGPTSATRRAGTARRRWTWSRCTAWPPTPTSGSWPRPAATTRTCSDALACIVNNHLASIVSDSWGDPADAARCGRYDLIFQAGAAEGIGFFFSSGDNGYEAPAEDPGRA